MKHDDRFIMLSDDDNYASRPIGKDEMDGKITPMKSPYISPQDVLCGRDKLSFNHTGNKRFRELVTRSLSGYIESENRYEKSLVIQRIVATISASGGRFLKKNSTTNNWFTLSDQQAKEKVGHAVRDAVNTIESRSKRKTKQFNTVKDDSSSSEKKHSADRVRNFPFEYTKPPPPESLRPQMRDAPILELNQMIPPLYRPTLNQPSRAAQLFTKGSKQSEIDSPVSKDDLFLARIDDVLGPLPPNAEDPMDPLLEVSGGKRR